MVIDEGGPEPDIKERARELRRQGLSYDEIAREKRRRFVQSVTDDVGKLSERGLVIAAAVAYWAEGTMRKPWRRTERIFWAQVAGVPVDLLQRSTLKRHRVATNRKNIGADYQVAW